MHLPSGRPPMPSRATVRPPQRTNALVCAPYRPDALRSAPIQTMCVPHRPDARRGTPIQTICAPHRPDDCADLRRARGWSALRTSTCLIGQLGMPQRAAARPWPPEFTPSRIGSECGLEVSMYDQGESAPQIDLADRPMPGRSATESPVRASVTAGHPPTADHQPGDPTARLRSPAGGARELLQLQRLAGNAAVQSLL